MSKDTFHAAFDDRKVLKFPNTKAGIEEFMEIVEEGFSIRETKIGVEATGVYHLLFALTLTEHSWNVGIINPLESHRMITQGLRTVKTDRIDAQKIRTMTTMGKGYPFVDTADIIALKALVVERQALVEMGRMTKQRINAHTLKERATGATLHDSFGALTDVLKAEIKKIERAMSEYEQEKQALLMSVPGVGRTTAATLTAFIGDINRFGTPEKLVAYVGLDSRVFESGTSIHGKGYISKRGNSYLRHILFNAAFIARRYNPELQAYYNKKRKEGKHYFSVMCAVERKLVHLIYAVWKRGTPYEVRSPK